MYSVRGRQISRFGGNTAVASRHIDLLFSLRVNEQIPLPPPDISPQRNKGIATSLRVEKMITILAIHYYY